MRAFAALVSILVGSSAGCLPDAGIASPTAPVAVASDVTGTKLVVVGTDVWTSSDAGATWIDRTPLGAAHDHAWSAVASDATGTNLVAVVNGAIDAEYEPDLDVQDGDIWTSSDGGASWSDRTPSGAAHRQAWDAVASDSTGTHLVAATRGQGVLGPGALWTSSDAGATWTNQTMGIAAMAQQNWWSLASDVTGTKLVAVANGGDIWTSSDGGATWTDRTTSAPGQGWSSVASDASGVHFVAAVDTGDLWTSADGGATWTDRAASSYQVWLSVASDATGANLIAIDALVSGDNGEIWASADGGATWTDETAGDPALSQPWIAVAASASGTRAVAVAPGAVWTR